MLQDYDTSVVQPYLLFTTPGFSSPPSLSPPFRPLLCPCQILLFISSLVRPVASSSKNGLQDIRLPYINRLSLSPTPAFYCMKKSAPHICNKATHHPPTGLSHKTHEILA
ncbi:hypothetical protein TNCV_3403781 [Trichonephila clavipes]|nr:hypothetical protein TNCV_3403781 [Trichonephila clavipes]